MSSTADAAPESAADSLAVVEEKPARRFPAPCWTQEETLALIEAYRERWYALRRGYLRTADWDAVAEAVFGRCPDASPAKTSAQCRHKMEKLRQRYRAEKQRSLSFPAGCFFSNWFFFENMDAMENGTEVSAARSNPNPDPDEQTNPGNNAFALKTLIDQGMLKSKPNNPRKLTKPADDSNPNFGPPVPNGYLSYFNVASSKKQQAEALPLENAFPIKTRVEAIPLAIAYNPKRNGDPKNGFSRGPNPNFTEYDDRNDPSEEYLMRMLEQSNSRGNFMEGPNLDRVVSGFPRSGNKSSGGSGVGLKREREPSDSTDQIASSIRFLAEGFIKIEKMKMEMAKEIEQMRMEREMKHSEMILESQKHIVGVFGKVLSEMKNNNKKAKTFASQGES